MSEEDVGRSVVMAMKDQTFERGSCLSELAATRVDNRPH